MNIRMTKCVAETAEGHDFEDNKDIYKTRVN